MSREIKFRYMWQHDETGRWAPRDYTLDEMQTEGFCQDLAIMGQRYTLIARRQFTGLPDKAGEDIYEGDVLKYNKSVSFPEYEHQQLIRGVAAIRASKGVVLNRSVIYYDYESSADAGEITRDVPRKAPHTIEVSGCWAEVIGDIYQNPELV